MLWAYPIPIDVQWCWHLSCQAAAEVALLQASLAVLVLSLEVVLWEIQKLFSQHCIQIWWIVWHSVPLYSLSLYSVKMTVLIRWWLIMTIWKTARSDLGGQWESRLSSMASSHYPHKKKMKKENQQKLIPSD